MFTYKEEVCPPPDMLHRGACLFVRPDIEKTELSWCWIVKNKPNNIKFINGIKFNIALIL